MSTYVLYLLLLFTTGTALTKAENHVSISWGTVGVAWALCTVTTIFIVAAAMKVQRALRSHIRKRRLPGSLASSVPLRENRRSGNSTHTRTTTLSSGGNRESDYKRGSSMKRSVSTKHSRRKTQDATSRWCTDHGLNENTARVLRAQGFLDDVTLGSLTVEDVGSLGLSSKAEECVLRRVLMENAEFNTPLSIEMPTEDHSPSAATGVKRYMRARSVDTANSHKLSSNSEVFLSRAGQSQASSMTGASTPLLDKTVSSREIQEIDAILENMPQMTSSRSYEVIDESNSRMFWAASSIQLSEAADEEPSQPSKVTANSKGFNGLLSDAGLHLLAGEIGHEWQQLGALLGVPNAILQQIRLDHVGNTRQQIYEMLRLWRDTASGCKEAVKGALQARLESVGRRDLAEKLLQEQVKGSKEQLTFHSIV